MDEQLEEELQEFEGELKEMKLKLYVNFFSLVLGFGSN